MRILEGKGLVRHEEESNAHRYFPLVDWREVGRGELQRLLRKVFKGSPELLLVQLLSDRRVDEDQLRRVRNLLDERLRSSPNDQS
jgi:predicted transcriptional regulator